MKSIAVFCGANTGFLPIFKEKTIELAQKLVERDIEVIFGGGSVGLMGVLADAVLERGGRVTGVITEYLNNQREVGHKGVSQMFILPDMPTRKIKLLELSEGIINLPGGFGSMDELFEALTLAQLHQYPYPIGLLNVDGFYDQLIAQIDVMIEKGFIRATNRGLLLIDDTIDGLLEQMQNYEYTAELKWQ